MKDMNNLTSTSWEDHIVYAGDHQKSIKEAPNPEEHREHIEPWLSALLQAEHLNLLVGSGLTIALAHAAKTFPVDMGPMHFRIKCARAVQELVEESAKRIGRGKPNIEDQVRVVLDLIAGLQVIAKGATRASCQDAFFNEAKKILPIWEAKLDKMLISLLKGVLATERGIYNTLIDVKDVERANQVNRLLGGLLLPFASRTGTRDRLHIFTTNYDRLIEYGCDMLGLRVIDRFVGNLAPMFQSSRLKIDLHYNPPGIRGEPRYLEGVVYYTKLHGSVDWRYQRGLSGAMEVHRCALPFGAANDHPEDPKKASDTVLIYPNPAKDIETLEYPYAELFRDFAAAVCRPNAVIATYGYGFGDDHVNRVLADMLTIPSTHLVIMSWDTAGGRIERFCKYIGRDEQITLLVGSHFGDLQTLIKYYLPKPAIDRTTWHMMDLLKRRARPHNLADEDNLESQEYQD